MDIRHLLLAGLALLSLQGTGRVLAAVAYDSIPAAVPPNVNTIAFGAGGITEFGDAVGLAGTGRALLDVTLLLSSGATRAAYGVGTAAGFVAPLTLTLYQLGSTGPNPQVGRAFAARSIQATIPWRPAASGACTNDNFLAGDGYCYSALATAVHFDFSGITVPDSLIFGLSFATAPGSPLDLLGLGFAPATRVGTDLNPDGVEVASTNPDTLSTGTLDRFGPDTEWGFLGTPAARFTVAEVAVPEPATLPLVAGALLLLLGAARRRP